jgi:hypothetical protein
MSLLRDCSGVPEFSGIAVLLIRGSPAALFYFPLVRKHLTFSSPVGACAVHDGATGTEISTSTRRLLTPSPASPRGSPPLPR